MSLSSHRNSPWVDDMYRQKAMNEERRRLESEEKLRSLQRHHENIMKSNEILAEDPLDSYRPKPKKADGISRQRQLLLLLEDVKC